MNRKLPRIAAVALALSTPAIVMLQTPSALADVGQTIPNTGQLITPTAPPGAQFLPLICN